MILTRKPDARRTVAILLIAVAATIGATAGAGPARAAGAPQGPAAPQTAGTPPVGSAAVAARTFTIRHKNINDVYLLISQRLGPDGSIQSHPRQKTLTVYDRPEILERVAALIAAYDLPPRTVEVSVQLILASTGGGSTPAPPPIRGVIEKLNALSTRWNDYRLLGSARVLGTEGENARLRIGDDYQVDFRIDQVAEDTRVVRFKPFELQKRELSVEGNERYNPVLSTVLNLRDSQLFIVGASKMETSNRALFMTITASVQTP